MTVVTSRLSRAIVHTCSDKGISGACDGPPGIGKAESRIVGYKHNVLRGEIPVRQFNRDEAGLLIAVGRNDDRIVVKKVVIKRKVIERDVVGGIILPDSLGLIAVNGSYEELSWG